MFSVHSSTPRPVRWMIGKETARVTSIGDEEKDMKSDEHSICISDCNMAPCSHFSLKPPGCQCWDVPLLEKPLDSVGSVISYILSDLSLAPETHLFFVF